VNTPRDVSASFRSILVPVKKVINKYSSDPDERLIYKMDVIHRAYDLAEKRQDAGLLKRATVLSQRLQRNHFKAALARYNQTNDIKKLINLLRESK
jgi:hypothetical protein